MERVNNLSGVKANAFPSSVLVLLSKYATVVKDADGVVIQLSSLNVFKHVHNSYLNTRSSSVKRYYRLLLREVNQHIAEGNMSLCPKFTKERYIEAHRNNFDKQASAMVF